jgi:mannose-6-phosphate isomerase-like protein (cupin superfamily)
VSAGDRLTTARALEALDRAGGATFVTLFERGSMSVEIYRPRKVDAQTPHEQDELYVVISGSGAFVRDGVSQPFEPGEVLFVGAGVPHRFEGLGDDLQLRSSTAPGRQGASAPDTSGPSRTRRPAAPVRSGGPGRCPRRPRPRPS